jgi:hypothetical protein
MALERFEAFEAFERFEEVSSSVHTLARMEACTLLCESHRNPEVESIYLRTDISKFGRYAVAISLHRLIVASFVNELF